MASHPERVIIVEPESFGFGYDVRVEPPVDDEPLDAEFRTHAKAMKWAAGLRFTRGWRIVDRTAEAAA